MTWNICSSYSEGMNKRVNSLLAENLEIKRKKNEKRDEKKRGE